MNRKIVAFSAVLLSGTLHAAAPAAVTNLQPLALDATGHPRLQWTKVSGAARYIIERRSDVNATGDTACLSTLETLVGGWCRFGMPAGTGSGTMIYTDPNIRMEPSSPVEYQYRVAAADAVGNQSAFVSRWANSCPIAVADSEEVYRDSVRNSGNQTLLSASDIASTADVKVTKIFSGSTILYYVVSNDKYIAMFGRKGGLVSLAHRNYGKDFVAGVRTAASHLYKTDGGQAWALLPADYSDKNLPAVPQVTSASQSDPDVVEVAGGIEFTWANAAGYRVTTTWTLQSLGYSGLHGRVSAVPVNASVGMEELRFPVVEGLGYDKVDLLWPQDIGRRYDNFPYRSENVAYDSRAIGGTLFAGTSMQFLGASYPIDDSNGNLLYIATEDPELSPKAFRIQPNALSNAADPNSPTLSAAMFVSYFPFNGTGSLASKVDADSHDYDVVMQPMCGDIAKIAKRYRKYAEQQDWTKIGENKTSMGGDPFQLVPAKTAARIDMPQKLKDGVFWWTQHNARTDTLWYMRDFAIDNVSWLVGLKGLIGPELGVDVGIQLFNWHTPGFDTNLPEYSEKLGGPVDFADYLYRVQVDGTLVAPYINVTGVDITDRRATPYLCDANNGTLAAPNSYHLVFTQQVCGWWNRNYMFGGISYDVQQQLTYKSTGASRSDAVITYRTDTLEAGMARLDSSFWMSMFNTNIATVFDAGAAGIYLDTFGAGYSPDFAELWGVHTDGKPIGHNKYWRYEMDAISETARLFGDQRDMVANTPNKRFVSAEHFGEAFIRHVDLFTLYSDHPVTAYPLAQLVYSDYQLFAGPQGRTADTDAARRLRYGRAFTWGMQPGLMGIQELCGSDQCDSDKLVQVVEYMKTLTRARKALADFLGLGEFLGVPVATNATQVSTNWCVDRECAKVDSARLPAIQAGRWLSISGERAFIVTNASLDSATATVAIPANWLGAPVNCFDEMHNITGCATVNAATGTLVIELQPLTVRYISFGVEDFDIDNDGIVNALDNCPGEANPLQTDIDRNRVGDACQNGLTARYFNDSDTNGSGISAGDAKLVAPAVFERIDANLDFSWGGSPGQGVISANYFSARWTGRLKVPAYTGPYQFCLRGDDGIRMWVDNIDLFGNAYWVTQDFDKHCATVSLAAGRLVPIKVEFFDLTGEAIVQLTWSYPGQAEQLVPTARLYAQ